MQFFALRKPKILKTLKKDLPKNNSPNLDKPERGFTPNLPLNPPGGTLQDC